MKPETHNKKYCLNCDAAFTTDASNCFLCGKPLIKTIPKCPACGSNKLERISDFKRATHFLAFGLLSNTAKSQFKCKDCGYKF